MTFFRILIISFTIATVYLNLKIFQSYKTQTDIVFDFNKQEFKSDNYKKLLNADIEFPNLSATAFPLYALLAKYHIMFEDYDSALDLLHKNGNVNPFMKIKESILAEAYLNLGIRDSSYYYSKIAFEGLPMNARHFQQYITELTYRKDVKKINEIFLDSKAKENYQYWLFYFSAMIKMKDKDERLVDSLARIAIDKFPSNNKIKLISSYILIGEENVKESYRLFDEGLKYFENSNYNLAAKKFIEAHEINPIDYSFSENAGMALIKERMFESALEYFDKSLGNKDRPDNGKSEFGKGVCYSELNDIDKACKYLKIAMGKNYKPAFGYYTKICK